MGVYQKRTSGTGQEELLVQGENGLRPRSWSRDGRFLLIMSAETGNVDLSVLPLHGDRKLEPFVASEFQETQGQFSPDGKWMAYTSNESGPYEVYVQAFPRRSGTEGKWKVSTAGGEDPHWRPDGKELFYLAPSGRLFAVPVQITGPNAGFGMGVPQALFDMHTLVDRWVRLPGPSSYDVRAGR